MCRFVSLSLTSYVNEVNLNTSHVSVRAEEDLHMTLTLMNLNTSHVSVREAQKEL